MVINQAVGDAISDMLMTLAILRVRSYLYLLLACSSPLTFYNFLLHYTTLLYSRDTIYIGYIISLNLNLDREILGHDTIQSQSIS